MMPTRATEVDIRLRNGNFRRGLVMLGLITVAVILTFIIFLAQLPGEQIDRIMGRNPQQPNVVTTPTDK